MSNIYHIRYNTNFTGETDRWRLIHRGKETLVKQVFIDGVKCTYKVWDEQSNRMKYHVSFWGDCQIINATAYITTNKSKEQKSKSILRHVLKTVSYRALGTLTTFIVSYVFTGSISIASTLGATELCVKPLLYFLHERIWYKFVKMKK